MYARSLRKPMDGRHSFFLFGPRGTGKTTWLKQRLPGALYGERGLLAFEVKRAGRLRRQDSAGLRLFARDYPPAKCFLLYGGDRREYHDGIEVWPLPEALRNLPSILSTGGSGSAVTG